MGNASGKESGKSSKHNKHGKGHKKEVLFDKGKRRRGSTDVVQRQGQVSEFLTELELREIQMATNYSAAELREMHFQYGFDANNELTQKQVEGVLAKRYSIDLSKSWVLTRLFEIFDVDNSGSVDFREFAEAMNIIERGTDDEKVGFVFRICDIDGNGEIDRVEFKTVVENIYENKAAQAILHFTLDEKEIRKMGGIDAFVDDFFVEADVDGDGDVSFVEYKRVMKEKNFFKQLHLTEDELADLFASKNGSWKNVLLVGPPCVGKGRLSAELERQFGLNVIGVNQLVQRQTRQLMRKKSSHLGADQKQIKKLGLSLSLGVTQLRASVDEPSSDHVDSGPGGEASSKKGKKESARKSLTSSQSVGAGLGESARHPHMLAARAQSYANMDQDLPDDLLFGVVDNYINDLRRRKRQSKRESISASDTGEISFDGSGGSRRKKSEERGWLIHGFPRTKGQLLLLNQSGAIPDKIIVLQCESDDVLKARLDAKLKAVSEHADVSDADLALLRIRFQRRVKLWRESKSELLRLIAAEGDEASRVFDVLCDDVPGHGDDGHAEHSQCDIFDHPDSAEYKSLMRDVFDFVEEGDVESSDSESSDENGLW